MRKTTRFAMSLCAVVALATGCGGSQAPGAFPHGASQVVHRKATITLPTYVIVMVQENRSVDNLFQTQPGVDTQNFGIDSHNNRVPLTKIDLGAPFDCDHSHSGFVADVTQGFDLEHCGTTAPPDFSFSYVNPAQITQYTALATQYAFADEVLQSNEGPTFPAHLYLIAATSGSPGSQFNISENDGHHIDIARKSHPSGCDAPAGKSDTSINMNTAFPGREGHRIYPCINPVTIFNELDSTHISWKYYTSDLASIGNAPYAIQSLYQNDKANVVVPETTVLSDIQNGQLAHVSYVMPSGRNSDHPGPGNTGGPTWVASVVNALGASQYWNQCSIIVVWDDWGGWFDHVGYRHPLSNPVDPYEYGLRVPLLAIGPFAKSNWVDHQQRDFSAIPHFIEDVYGLPSLGRLDSQTDDLFSLFNFGQNPRKFKPIPTGSVTIKGLINRPPDLTPIDSE
ncbi:MAG TPA: alkaline phosphatase family protein [Candidatus Eremiobacteraceae bacterium]